MKIHIVYGNCPATDLESVLARMRRLGASNADCLWTRRWVESFFRYCAKKRTAPDRGAAIDWLRWQKSKEGDERSEWRYQQAKTALANYIPLSRALSPANAPSDIAARQGRLSLPLFHRRSSVVNLDKISYPCTIQAKGLPIGTFRGGNVVRSIHRFHLKYRREFFANGLLNLTPALNFSTPRIPRVDPWRLPGR